MWDWRAAIQFIGGGTGTGLLVFAAAAAQGGATWALETLWPALAFVASGLLAVFLELGRRRRAAFVVRNPASSWMTREALLAPPLLGAGLLAAVLRSPALALVAAAIGVGFLYAQARIPREATGIPIWRESLIVPLLISTGLAEGAGAFLMATLVFGEVGSWAPASLLLLIVGRAALWTAYRRRVSRPGAAPVRSVEALAQCDRLLAPAGHALPALAALGALLFPRGVALLGFVAGLSALLGGWYLKLGLITRAAYNQGFALPRTPARAPGHAGPGTKPGWV